MHEPVTEQINSKTIDIDRRSTLEIVTMINEEDKTVAEAVSRVLGQVARAVDIIAERMEAGGDLLYVGTGTSGRLGSLDASECMPTFGIPPERVRAIIAGGYEALYRAVEAAEDDPEQSARDLEAAGVSSRDVVVAISASGNTPYTLGAIEHAKKTGAVAIAVTCNPDSRMAAVADVSIAPVVGPEVIAGSSRMKAGTAQKMILNMLSTATMIRLGLVYGNLMSNLKAGNEKLRHRSLAILAAESSVSPEEASDIFEEAGRDLRIALLMARANLPRRDAERLLKENGYSVRRALEDMEEGTKTSIPTEAE
ncbi:MAG: N-acetylmuramic acid 6-phosphate etherase [Blastocatellia bacterium]|nr:N-acetylmuramic acid 6-phosphate etherase [Blastocatellia bacterium]